MRKAMNISVSAEMHDFIRARAQSRYYSSTSEYIRSLVRRDQIESEKPKRRKRDNSPEPRRANEYFDIYRDELESIKNEHSR